MKLLIESRLFQIGSLLPVLVLLCTGLEAVERPNIIVIMADDVGYDAIGAYGGESYPTPHLDDLAKSGLMGMHCYSMPVCHPTRITFMTGMYPTNVQNPKWGSFPKVLEQQTIASVMQRAGYRTVVTGKWQLALLKNDPLQPHRMGFDQYCVFGWHEGPRYHSPLVYENGKVNTAAQNQVGPDVYREYLEQFIIADREKPFFAFYSMALCHDVTDDLEKPVPYSPSGEYLTYKEMAVEMDRQIGLLVQFLTKHNLREQTLLMFTTDNGTAAKSCSHFENGKYIKPPVFSMFNGKRIQGGKGKLDDSGTRVPLILSWPGVVKPATVTDALVDMSDFYATCAALSGQEVPAGLDSLSFVPALTGRPVNRVWAYAEGRGQHWVRDQKYKLYGNGRFVEVDQHDLSKETVLKGELSPEATQAFKKLQSARPHRTQ
ncbi:MAG: Cerebroside-sulfatase [Planctomycetaceae bacterium]|nr:Cerebroside-sulfatase [Planctomycetaceae bacterium]